MQKNRVKEDNSYFLEENVVKDVESVMTRNRTLVSRWWGVEILGSINISTHYISLIVGT